MRKFMQILTEMWGGPRGLEVLSMPADQVTPYVVDAKIATGENFSTDDEDELVQVVANDQKYLKKLVAYDNTIDLYRAITVDQSFIDNLQPGASLGVYWSHHPAGAFAYDGANDKVVLVISANVNAEDVDWVTTLAVQDAAESEIRLFPGTQLKVFELHVQEGRYDRDKRKPVRKDLWGQEFQS